MREFSPEYLSRTRRGMWDDDRTALTDLRLDSRTHILEVGCGTGEFTTVLREETDARITALDADRDLLTVARDALTVDHQTDHDHQTDDRQPTAPPAFLTGAAGRLPFPDDTFDLVVCQALLVNLPGPDAIVREFTRVSTELVAAVEPVNSEVAVTSSVDSEPELESEARAAFMAGAQTGVAGDVTGWFADADLSARIHRYEHEKRIEPPYSEADLRGAKRKATGAALADHETELRRALADDYDDLRRRWRRMGRAVVEQMQHDEYRRVERVPFDVAVASVSD